MSEREDKTGNGSKDDTETDAALRKKIKAAGDSVPVKPALGKIRRATSGKSGKDTGRKKGDR